MKRIYHPYWEWEDWKAGMWHPVSASEAQDMLARAIEFTGNAALYGSFMQRVIREWPKACEHNLTETEMNRQAWIGHAACVMATGIPEHITRKAWGCLTQQQQDDANEQAQRAIDQWTEWHEAKNP